MQSMFKVITINTFTDPNLHLDTMFVELSEVEYDNITLPSGNKSYSCKLPGKYFLFSPESYIAKRIRTEPEKLHLIELDEFSAGQVETEKGTENALFHCDYRMNLNFAQNNLDELNNF